tara:strand:+ start:352 stop:504 length:153 start_codon:yes stop_codon:yes gene_type:complete
MAVRTKRSMKTKNINITYKRDINENLIGEKRQKKRKINLGQDITWLLSIG